MLIYVPRVGAWRHEGKVGDLETEFDPSSAAGPWMWMPQLNSEDAKAENKAMPAISRKSETFTWQANVRLVASAAASS
jgi:hypothetical protein